MFSAVERRAVSSLAAVIGLRMFGLFLIVPVLALHAGSWVDATPLLLGIALGVYGLTQAILQIPFGLASDKWGRKPVISFGIMLFAIGCVIAATADTLIEITIGRAVQGAGSIAAAVFALAGDLTRDNQRNKAMAIIGVSIGSAFILSFIMAPILDGLVGLAGMFWVAFALAVVGLLLIWFVVPNPETPMVDSGNLIQKSKLREVILDASLLRLYSGSFSLHAVLTALFVAFPITLVEAIQIDSNDIWKIYVPTLLLSAVAMVPLIKRSSRENQTINIMLTASIILFAGAVALSFGIQTPIILIFGFWLFFVGFNTLEALLPSTTIRMAPAQLRGAAMGSFNTCTFIGAFVGGVAGGLLQGAFGELGVYVFCAVVMGLWTLVTFSLRKVAFSQ